jgi:hypothetical protein
MKKSAKTPRYPSSKARGKVHRISLNKPAVVAAFIQLGLELTVRRGSVMVRRVSVIVRRGSVGSASACCKAGPSSILGSAPQGGVSH